MFLTPLKIFMKHMKHRPNFFIINRHFETLDDIRIDRHYIKDFQDLKSYELLPEAKYGGENLVTLIVADTRRSKRSATYITEAFEIMNAPILFEPLLAETCCIDNQLEPNTEALILSMLRNRYALSLDVYSTVEKKIERNKITNSLNTFASVMHCFTPPGYITKFPKTNIIMITQNGRRLMEYEPVKGVIETLRITTYNDMYEFVEFAYQYAVKRKRRKITFIHNELYFKKSEGLTFLNAIKNLKKKYSRIKTFTEFGDKTALKLVQNPQQFDVICCEERFGTMITTMVSAVCGSPCLFSVCNMGKTHGLFQPLENRLSVPVIGNDPSPFSIFSAGAHMLSVLGYYKHADLLWRAIYETMKKGYKTKELGGSCTSEKIFSSIMKQLYNVRLGKKQEINLQDDNLRADEIVFIPKKKRNLKFNF